jgi:hypothetical protein
MGVSLPRSLLALVYLGAGLMLVELIVQLVFDKSYMLLAGTWCSF